MEIGTSDFNNYLLEVHAELQAGKPASQVRRGVSVDAMSLYLDRLPTLPAEVHKKLNYAVTGFAPHNDTVTVYYVTPEDIADPANGLPDWIRGCNRVGQPHPAHEAFILAAGKAHLLHTQPVRLVSVQELLAEVGGCRLGQLKLDVEGLDGHLLLGYADFLWQHPECRADVISFEYKPLGGVWSPGQKESMEGAFSALSLLGYRGATEHVIDPVFVYNPVYDARIWAQRSLLNGVWHAAATALGEASHAAQAVLARGAQLAQAGGFGVAHAGSGLLDAAALDTLATTAHDGQLFASSPFAQHASVRGPFECLTGAGGPGSTAAES